jgi:hypothetical protein
VYLPSGQAAQIVALVAGSRPANSKPSAHRQSSPSSLPASENELAWHGKHPSPPVCAAQVPGRASPKKFAAQGAQAPVSVAAKPSTHAHSAALALPSARVVALPVHATHAAEPVLSLCVPTGHASQFESAAMPE